MEFGKGRAVSLPSHKEKGEVYLTGMNNVGALPWDGREGKQLAPSQRRHRTFDMRAM